MSSGDSSISGQSPVYPQTQVGGESRVTQPISKDIHGEIQDGVNAQIGDAFHELADDFSNIGQKIQRTWQEWKQGGAEAEGNVAAGSSDQNVEKKPLSTMSKVGYVVREFFAKLSKSVADTLKTYKEDHFNYRFNQGSDLSVSGDKTVAVSKNMYGPRLDHSDDLMKISDPSKAMVPKADLNNPFDDHKLVAEEAVKTKVYENVAPKDIGIGTLRAYTCQGGELEENAVTPTSYFLGTENEEARNHLMNAYVVVLDGKEVAVIRSGKIDTMERANDFIKVVEKIHDDLKKDNSSLGKLRITSNQLNSPDFGIEKKIIDNQHCLMAHVNSKLKGKAEVAHFNFPFNRFYHGTMQVIGALNKIGLSGVADLVEKHVLTGERLSKEQNLESWGKYMNWVLEDIDKSLKKTGLEHLPLVKEGASFGEDSSTLGDTFKKLTTPNKENLKLINSKLKAKAKNLSYIAANESKIKESQLKSDKLKQEVKDLEKDLSTHLGDARFLAKKKGALEAQLEKEDPKNQGEFLGFPEKQQKVAQLNAEITNLTGELIQARKKGEKLSTNIQTKKAELEQLNTTIEGNKSAIRGIKADIKEKQSVETERKKLRGDLENQLKSLKDFQKTLSQTLSQDESLTDDQKKELTKILRPISLIVSVLESQLETNSGLSKMSRGSETLSVQLVNKILGVTVAINCKSGLDRTAILHAITLALESMEKANIDCYDMVENWDTITAELNKKLHTMSATEFENWLEAKVDDTEEATKEKEMMRQVIEFRKVVLDNLIQLGLPITKTSTGLEGLKWSPQSMEENLMALNFLPSHVMIDNQRRTLVNYDSSGEPKGITTVGTQLLTKFSGLRGS